MNLQLKASRIPGRTAQAWPAEGDCYPAVCHPSLKEGVYAYHDAYVLDEHAHNVRHQFGDRVIELVGPKFENEVLYLFAQHHPFGVSPNAVGLPPELFDAVWSAALKLDLQMEVDRTWLQWGAMPVDGPMQDERVAALAYYRVHPPAYPTILRRHPSHATWALPPVQNVAGDRLFGDLYPEVPPLYRPHSLLAWYAWLLHRPDAVDKSLEGPVSGFAGVARQRITDMRNPHRVELQVTLLEAGGRAVGQLTVSLEGSNLRIRTASGHQFYIKDTPEAPVLYFSDGITGYSWDGRDQLKFGTAEQILHDVPWPPR